MAEIALPLIGLGALYVISNNKKENFVNMGANPNERHLPNTHVPNPNFPIREQPINVKNSNYVRQYQNPNQTTDRFFETGNNSANQDDIHINSLSGNKVSKENFSHNNMVPFFGSKVRGPQIDSNHSETILDHRQGAGSHQIKRVEQAPLFKPEDNVQFTHGMPSHTDFLQSRQMPSTMISNVVPWKQEKVAPGLGLGFTTEGSNGFNSGMMDRNAWKPPTVDELRVKTRLEKFIKT